MEATVYRAMHKASQSVALITFEVSIDGQVKCAKLEFLKGNVLDLDKYRKYAKFELNRVKSVRAATLSL